MIRCNAYLTTQVLRFSAVETVADKDEGITWQRDLAVSKGLGLSSAGGLAVRRWVLLKSVIGNPYADRV